MRACCGLEHEFGDGGAYLSGGEVLSWNTQGMKNLGDIQVPGGDVRFFLSYHTFTNELVYSIHVFKVQVRQHHCARSRHARAHHSGV